MAQYPSPSRQPAVLMPRAEVELAKRELIELWNATEYRVTCLQGQLWITQDADPDDVVLSPGDSFVIDRSGLTLVQALRPARLRIFAPALDAARNAALPEQAGAAG